MKNMEDIISRSVILLAFCDRCSLEKNVINGIYRSVQEREYQRKAVINWLIKMGYEKNIEPVELDVFNTSINEKTNEIILNFQNNYEALQPLLWSLGLIRELSNYDDYVIDDFHPTLNFGKNHSFESLCKNVQMVSNESLQKHRDRAMLWYWRMLESRNSSSRTTNMIHAISTIFGEKYTLILKELDNISIDNTDFLVNGVEVRSLSDMDIKKLLTISEIRFRAFEWICTDFTWENIDLVC